jgi:hypothetical protein
MGLLVLVLALPATAGGRDVPDKDPNTKGASQSQSLPLDGGTVACDDRAVEFTTIGGLRFVMSWDENGRVSIRPAFLSELRNAIGRLLRTDSGSCAG